MSMEELGIGTKSHDYHYSVDNEVQQLDQEISSGAASAQELAHHVARMNAAAIKFSAKSEDGTEWIITVRPKPIIKSVPPSYYNPHAEFHGHPKSHKDHKDLHEDCLECYIKWYLSTL